MRYNPIKRLPFTAELWALTLTPRVTDPTQFDKTYNFVKVINFAGGNNIGPTMTIYAKEKFDEGYQLKNLKDRTGVVMNVDYEVRDAAPVLNAWGYREAYKHLVARLI